MQASLAWFLTSRILKEPGSALIDDGRNFFFVSPLLSALLHADSLKENVILNCKFCESRIFEEADDLLLLLFHKTLENAGSIFRATHFTI